jgi:hypothetical protein
MTEYFALDSTAFRLGAVLGAAERGGPLRFIIHLAVFIRHLAGSTWYTLPSSFTVSGSDWLKYWLYSPF